MHGILANTDQDWFNFLAQHPEFDEVNFWAPSGRVGDSTATGTPFLFKLKSPIYKIGGFGFLGPVIKVPMSIAWETFGPKNGAVTQREMTDRLRRYRPDAARSRGAFDPVIGCRTILEPVFFPQELWVAQPSDWPKNIVTSKSYDLTTGEGRRVWEECLANRHLVVKSRDLGTPAVGQHLSEADDAPRFGSERMYRPRLGQGAFRFAVTKAYGAACAVTGEHSLPVLDAAHIQPYADEGPHEVSNGILLRSDLHRLYDKGYVTVTPDYNFRVSEALREEYENGKVYYDLAEHLRTERRTIRLPRTATDHPDRDRLQWHEESVFRG
jgi:putative restriction endonuclease